MLFHPRRDDAFMKKKELKSVPVTNLVPYKNNPRKNDMAVEAVARSLQEYGYIKNSIGIDENMVLLYGHTTLKAMISLGWDKVPEVTQVSGLTEAQKTGYRIAVNFNKKTCCDNSIPLFVALCHSCHSKTGFNRDYWQEHFTLIINEQYGGRCYLPRLDTFPGKEIKLIS